MPPTARFTCAADADCPAGRECSEGDGVCVAVGAPAPTLDGARLEPAAAGAGTLVRLTTEANVDLAAAALVDPRGAGFGDAAIVGKVAAFELVVPTAADALADGFYPLDAVDLTGLDGRSRRWPLDLVLHVDRRAPALVAAAEGGGARYSDVDGSDTIALSWSADEPLAAPPVIQIEGADGAGGCEALPGAGAASGTCSLVIDVARSVELVATDVVLRGADAAGNDVETRVRVPVDFLPPSVVDASVVVTAPDGDAETAAVPGSLVAIDLVVSEPLAQAPTVALLGDLAIEDEDTTQVSALRWRTTFVVVGVPDVDGETSGAIDVAAELVDLVGHTAQVEQPGLIPYALARQGPCLVDADCADVDGDGHFAFGATCAIGDDCDDGDALVSPEAPELPGDGVRNDCQLGDDAPLADSAGFFVDPNAVGASDAGPCTLAQPCVSVFPAVNGQSAARRFAFVLSGAHGLDGVDTGPLSIVGVVRDAAAPGGVRLARASDGPRGTLALSGAPDVQLRGPLVHGVTVTGSLGLDPLDGPLALVDVRVPDFHILDRRLLVVGATLDALEVRGDFSRIIDATVEGQLDVMVPGVVVHRTLLDAGAFVGPGASLEIVSSVVLDTIAVDNATSLAITQSVVIANSTFATLSIQTPATRLSVVSSILDVANTTASTGTPGTILFFSGELAALAFRGNQVSTRRPAGVLQHLNSGDHTFAQVAQFEALDPADRAGNRVSPSADVDDNGNVVVGSDGVVTTGLAQTPGAALDFFGHCFTDPPFAGADASLALDER